MNKLYQQKRRGQRGYGIVAQTCRRKHRKPRSTKGVNGNKERKFHTVPIENLIVAMKNGILRHCKQSIDLNRTCFLRKRSDNSPGKPQYILFQQDGKKQEVIAMGGEKLNELLYH